MPESPQAIAERAKVIVATYSDAIKDIELYYRQLDDEGLLRHIVIADMFEKLHRYIFY